MTTKIIAFYEKTWMPMRTDWRQWDHLTRAFNVELQMINDWSEAEVGSRQVWLVDEEGETDIRDHIWRLEFFVDKSCYVFGRTGMRMLNAQIPHTGSIHIPTPRPISLFGITAAAVLLGLGSTI